MGPFIIFKPENIVDLWKYLIKEMIEFLKDLVQKYGIHR